MFLQPQHFTPVPMMPRVPASVPDFRPRVMNEQFFDGSGAGIVELGRRIGSQNVMGGSTFNQAMLQSLDRVSAYQMHHHHLIQQAIVDPGTVTIEDITMAQARAGMSLNIARTILNRVVQTWQDIINTR